MIDTHSHLFENDFSMDLEQCIQRCKQNNVNKIMLVGFSEDTNQKAFEMSEKYDLFYPTAGVHPSEANSFYDNELKKLEAFLQTHKVYAIGECGLDYHYGKDNIDFQKRLFEGQVQLSIKYNLPLIIHMREATKDTFDILKKYEGKARGIMHCYSGSYEMAKEFIKLGYFIALGGAVTFKNAKESKLVAEKIPLDNLLLETDCPYMAPTPYRGKRNESSYIIYVASEIANIRKMDVKELEDITTKNSEKIFGI